MVELEVDLGERELRRREVDAPAGWVVRSRLGHVLRNVHRGAGGKRQLLHRRLEHGDIGSGAANLVVLRVVEHRDGRRIVDVGGRDVDSWGCHAGERSEPGA